MEVADLGPTEIKNIVEPMRVYLLQVGKPAPAKPIKPDVSKRQKCGDARRRDSRAHRDRGRRMVFP